MWDTALAMMFELLPCSNTALHAQRAQACCGNLKTRLRDRAPADLNTPNLHVQAAQHKCPFLPPSARFPHRQKHSSPTCEATTFPPPPPHRPAGLSLASPSPRGLTWWRQKPCCSPHWSPRCSSCCPRDCPAAGSGSAGLTAPPAAWPAGQVARKTGVERRRQRELGGWDPAAAGSRQAPPGRGGGRPASSAVGADPAASPAPPPAMWV